MSVKQRRPLLTKEEREKRIVKRWVWAFIAAMAAYNIYTIMSYNSDAEPFFANVETSIDGRQARVFEF